MADRGRDLKINILSDAERFDLAHPADELEKVADAAADTSTRLADLGRDAQAAGSDLDALSRDGKSAGTDLDALGKDARAAATKVDHAFDTIAKSSRQKLGDGVDSGTDKARKSLRGVADEAHSTARETAASFTGTATDVADSFQEIAANALGALGPAGAAIGIAGAIGFGVLRAQAEKTKETITGLVTTMVSQGGKLGRGDVLDKLKEFAQDGSLVDLKRQAQAAKIPVNDFLLAMAGDPAALERTNAAVKAARDGIDDMGAVYAGPGGSAVLKQSDALVSLGGALRPVAENYAAAAEAARVYESATGGASIAQEAFSDSLTTFTDPLGTYTDALTAKETAEQKTAEATATATKDQSDSWEDYATDVDLTLAEYMTSLTKQVAAQEEWAANMTTLAGKVPADVLAELARMGPEGAPLVADLVNASDKELTRFVALSARRGKAAVDAQTAALAAGADPAATAGGKVGKAYSAAWVHSLTNAGPETTLAARGLRTQAAEELEKPLEISVVLNPHLFNSQLGALKRSASGLEGRNRP